MADVPPLTDPDLGSMIARLIPKLMALEEPILAEAGLSMWEYVIVDALAAGTALSQVELSQRTRRDTTRLGRHLDDLVARGVVTRQRSTDQRRRTVQLTQAGQMVHEQVKRSIRSVEDEVLRTTLGTAKGAEFRKLLLALAESESTDRS